MLAGFFIIRHRGGVRKEGGQEDFGSRSRKDSAMNTGIPRGRRRTGSGKGALDF